METGEERLFGDLIPGTGFRGIFVVRNVRMNDSGPRVAFTLADRTGDTRRAVLWEASSAEIAQLYGAQFLDVEGSLSGAGDRFPNQVTVNGWTEAPPHPDRVARFLPPLPADQAATCRRFDVLLASVANPHLSHLLSEIFQGERRIRFEEAVAATGHHHAYRGGLLRHTVEVAELCRAACRSLPFLRHDLLVAGALLHDIGKLFEMHHDLRAGEFTDTGILEGHTVSGAFFVGKRISDVKGFPAGLNLALRHLILSHADRPEWGAAHTPALPEAVVLAKCDQISAHATEFNEAITAAATGQRVAWRGEGRCIFTGDLHLDTLDLGGMDAPVAPDALALSLADLPADIRLLCLPVRGLVAAGDGERSSEEPEATGDRIAAVLPAGGADYVVAVTGESMIGAGILPGDRVYVRHQETATPGDLVIAYVPTSGNVVKRYAVTPQGALLLSENPDTDAYPPIPVTEVTRIQGIVTRIERDLYSSRR